jgi:diguanylate cyclase (GGDEF)-like protein/PAS domain S-box-containing protein
MDINLLNYISSPAIIIDINGKINAMGKAFKHNIGISLNDNFFNFCLHPSSLPSIIADMANSTTGSEQLTRINCQKLNKAFLIKITLVNAESKQFLIEFVENNQVFFNNTLGVLADYSDNLLSLVDHRYHYISVNQRYSDTWGIPKDRIEGHHVADVMGEETFKNVIKQQLDSCFSGHISNYTDWFYSEQHKKMLFLKVCYRPVQSENSSSINSVAVTVTDITDVRSHHDQLTEKAFKDPLTGMNNRHALEEHFSDLSKSYQQCPDKKYCIVFLDLDKFKPVNDEFGHDVGDLILVKFAKQLKSVMRKDDFYCRWGGDEFVLILPIEDEEMAALVLQKRLEKIKHLFCNYEDITISISFSYGFSFFPRQSRSLDKLINMADQQMYSAKAKQKSISQQKVKTQVTHSR